MLSKIVPWIPVAALVAVLGVALATRSPADGELPAKPSPAPLALPSPEVQGAAPPPFERPVSADLPARPPRSPGPLGERVGAMAEELSLQESQRGAYRNLLESYALRFELLHQNTDWTRAGSRLQFEADHATLQREFDLLIVRLLTPEQADRYVTLPDWYRTADLGPVALHVEVERRR